MYLEVAQIALPNGHVITQEHDALTRLTASTLVASNGTVWDAQGYQLNLGHQRTNQVFTNATLTLAGERMGYTYDNIGQLKTATGKLSDGTTAWGTNKFGYAYDAAWNLTDRTNNGTPESFTVDSLNQLTSGGCVYDLNGNLRTNGSMVLEYDAENQLTNVFVAGIWRTELFYDFAGRLKWRREYTWNGSAWGLSLARRYIYDGMLVVQERNGPGGVALVGYTRGLDLSGSLQGAGGIGGLLARTQHTGTDAGTGYYHSDGNGNVTAILAPDGNSLLAAYLFDPYGRTLQSSGVWAVANAYRFSSKEYLTNSGLYYYGFRFYAPSLQRWINRDPIEEAGGINLYGFVGNRPVGAVDLYGLSAGKIIYRAGEIILENGKRIAVRNWKFRDKNVSLDMLRKETGVCRERIKRLEGRYGKDLDIPFDSKARPDFSKHKLRDVAIDVTGDQAADSAAAWKKLGDKLNKSQEEIEGMYGDIDLIWHHSGDGKMQLLDKDLHTAYAHTGEAAIERALRAGMFAELLAPHTSDLVANGVMKGKCGSTEAFMAVAVDGIQLIDPGVEDVITWTWNSAKNHAEIEMNVLSAGGIYTGPLP